MIETESLEITESLKIKELEQAIVEKAGQLFYGPGLAFGSTLYLKPRSAVGPLESVVSPRTGRAHTSAYGCSVPATGKLLRAILATEQNLASEVLGVKGANARQRPVSPEVAIEARDFAHVFANHTIKRYSG